MKEIFQIAKLKAKPNCQLELEKELKALAEAAQEEPGCLLYTLHRDRKDPSMFILLEKFASIEALNAHLATPHFKKHFPSISKLMSGQPEVIEMETLFSGKKTKV